MQSSPFRALTHYRLLPALAGWPFLVFAFGARAAYAMIPLGTLTAVTVSTGSVAQGGFATGVVAIATAIAVPLIGRWADTSGHRAPLLILTPLNALALAGLFICTTYPAPTAALYLACTAVGCTSLPIGALARSQWVSRVQTPQQMAAALSYESMADELVFVLGPALVGIAASTANATIPLLLATILVATFGMAFALRTPRRLDPTAAPASPEAETLGAANNHSSTQDLRHRKNLQVTDSTGLEQNPESARTHTSTPSIGSIVTLVFPCIIVAVTIGFFFGATQAGLTMRMQLLGEPTTAGLIYALMGVGSAVMAILSVLIPERISLAQRLMIGGCGLFLFMSATALSTHLALTCLLLLVCGLFIGPTLVTNFSIVEVLAPTQAMAVAMTLMQSALTVGTSSGSAVGGYVAQTWGDVPALITTSIMTLVITGVGIALKVGKSKKNR
ncbi:MFS transporter [Gleimia hominis]|uniref:MFS transporter n=1 Tax=Gleimia hominis TaxID=595468 RepID=A0ABU3IB09_9ACTO|nr:MFS transporter [Gleimia hominis]MDT3767563.1 MFS transporter [Gleimia hominis]